MRPALTLSCALALAALLGGCGTPAEPERMSLRAAERLQLRSWIPEALRGQIRLGKVEGGAETWRYWGSKISDESLRIALDESLRGVGLAALMPEGGRFELQARLLKLEQPKVAADVTVALYMHYRLVEVASGKLVYERQMRLVHTTPLDAAWLDMNERLRLANEAALHQSLEALVRELIELRPA
ncbi:hypothetical protein H5407_05670 [Mitsuaria sp. WAJ17]|uniref:hypothetical protein n=1 Tax=Mitsuaria sp. WAJ17 TaxID=2761452 RepID=UPI00160236A5|nr:hypothetical protein [Mitsuaria sp. WAJ17]MBB2484711.1 hypothetical protein [Mitsuaria sp. WAJ17]